LSKILRVPFGAYNGVLSNEKMIGGVSTTKEQRIDTLNREAVSTNISAVIKQSICKASNRYEVTARLYLYLYHPAFLSATK